MIGNLLLAFGLTFAVGVTPLSAGGENPTNLYDGGYASLSSPISIETTLGSTLTNFVLNEDLFNNGANLSFWAFNLGDEGQVSYTEDNVSGSIGNMNVVNSYFNSHSDCVFALWFFRSNNFYIIETFWRYYTYQNMSNNMLVFDFSTYNFTFDYINVYTGYNNYAECKIGSLSSDYQYVYRPSISLSDFIPNTTKQSYIGGGLLFEVDGSATQSGGYFDFNCCVAFEKESDYTQGYNTGYSQGYTEGQENGEQTGYHNGYIDGQNAGMQISQTSFMSLFASLVDTPMRMLYSLFNFDLFGTSMLIIILSTLTAIVVIKILKKFI